MLGRPFFWIIALVVAAFVVSPLIGDDVQLRESLALAAVYITLASNLNLMLGYAGYINFGSIVFFGLGGYICIWLVDAHHWPLAKKTSRGLAIRPNTSCIIQRPVKSGPSVPVTAAMPCWARSASRCASRR